MEGWNCAKCGRKNRDRDESCPTPGCGAKGPRAGRTQTIAKSYGYRSAAAARLGREFKEKDKK